MFGFVEVWLQMINLKLVFRSLSGRCHGDQFFGFDRRRLVAQPGGLTSGLALRLVDL